MSRQRTREVVAVHPSHELMLSTMPPRGDAIEVRERRDGTFRVFYPDEGFVPCPPVCDLKHSHDYKQGWSESYYQPTDLDDAIEWATSLAEERQVRVIRYGERQQFGKVQA